MSPVQLESVHPERLFQVCETLVAGHLVAALARFGAPALGVINLPPISTAGSVEPAQLKVAAVLFCAAELEDTGLLDFVDALATGLVEGKLLLPLTTGADHLMEYWRGRAERFGARERQALYERVFSLSDTTPSGFAAMFDALCGALGRIGRAASTESLAPHQAQVTVLSQELASELSGRTVGITAFAARELLAQLQEATRILEDHDINMVFGGGSIWQLLRAHAPSILGRPVEPEAALGRARYGMAILQWLAAAAPAYESAAAALVAGSPVVQAALGWQAATGTA